MKKVKSILIAALITMTAATAFASTETKVPSFEALDLNRDNVISKTEANTNHDVKKQFEKADVNEDKTLTKGEFAYIIHWTEKARS